MTPTLLQKKWKTAADDLAIKIIFPFQSSLQNGKEIRGEFLLPQFGAAKGMIIAHNLDDTGATGKELVEEGYGYCIFREPKHLEEYNRRITIEVLQDWGWSGEESAKPSWLRSE